MNLSSWYELQRNWAVGSSSCPVAEPIINICRLGRKIKIECKRTAIEISDIQVEYLQTLCPNIMEIHDMLVDMLGIFEAMCIRAYNPSQEDLENETAEEETQEEVEEGEENTDKIFKEVSEMKSDDMELKNLIEKVKEKKNILDEFKKTIKVFKIRTDIQSIYRDRDVINYAQIMSYLHNIISTVGGVKSTLMFAKKYFNNYCGIRIAVLFFMNLMPEVTYREVRLKEVRNA